MRRRRKIRTRRARRAWTRRIRGRGVRKEDDEEGEGRGTREEDELEPKVTPNHVPPRRTFCYSRHAPTTASRKEEGSRRRRKLVELMEAILVSGETLQTRTSEWKQCWKAPREIFLSGQTQFATAVLSTTDKVLIRASLVASGSDGIVKFDLLMGLYALECKATLPATH